MVYSLWNKDGIPLEQLVDALFEQKRDGFFVELGANDGLTQSNTAFFEKERGWKGILIEPSLEAYERCIQNRPNSNVFRCACVSKDYPSSSIEGDFTTTGLMASVDGTRRPVGPLCSVPARTIESVLEEGKCPARIDLLSLDVEGYELNVLQGFDFEKVRPHYFLIEVYAKDYDAITRYLSEKNYALVSNLSGYTNKTNPGWDGTHNDYLFCDTTR
jgi:FkbM family methyltransferase